MNSHWITDSETEKWFHNFPLYIIVQNKIIYSTNISTVFLLVFDNFKSEQTEMTLRSRYNVDKVWILYIHLHNYSRQGLGLFAFFRTCNVNWQLSMSRIYCWTYTVYLLWPVILGNCKTKHNWTIDTRF